MDSTRYGVCAVTTGYTLFLVFTIGGATAAGGDNASVRGIVSNSITGERLAKAYVRLAPASHPTKIRPTLTDEEGRFLFKDVQPGNYSLEAEHQGFMEGVYGDAIDVPLELRVAAGQDLSGLKISLIPPGAISGRVTNEDGDPWTHAVVGVFRSRWKRGKRLLEGFTSAEVDDKGEFRAGHLPPGRYYVAAEPDRHWEATNRAVSEAQLQPTWYPNSLDSSTAVPAVLVAGQELTGTDIRLRRLSVYRIRGKVQGIREIPVLQGPRLWMRPRLSVLSATGTGNTRSGVMNEDGSFEVEGVAPGSYQVRVEQGMLPTLMKLGSASIRVDNHNIDDVSITVRAPNVLKGVMRIDGNDAALPSGLRLWLDSTEGLVFEANTTVQVDGSFAFDNVPTGQYRIQIRGGASEGYYLKALGHGGVEGTDLAFSFSGAADTIELTLSAHGAHVSGVIRRNDRARSMTARVVLIPDTRDTGLVESDTHAAMLDQSGVFTVKDAIRPGEYTLYAFEGVPEGAWTDAEFMKEIEGKGVRVKPGEGDVKTVEIPLIPRPDLTALITRLGMN